jgi:hypothetical protein
MSKRGSVVNLSKVTRDDLIYLAGLIDGDGCFFISKRSLPTKAGLTQYMLKLQVHCIDEGHIDQLHAIYGGVKVINRKKPPRRNLYGIEFTGKLLTHMCELLIPFLKLKKTNCENMLKMRKTYNGTGGNIVVPNKILKIRDECFAFSRSINTHKPFVIPPCLPSALCSEEVQVN